MKASILLLSYNNERSIGEALEAACAQDVDDYEILVGDDSSRDDSFAIAQSFARHQGRGDALRVFRHPSNLGIVGNIVALAAQATAPLLILAAGDDRMRSDRVRKLVTRWETAGKPEACVLYSDVRPIDEQGALVANWPERVARPPWSLKRLARGREGPLGAGCAITPDLLSEPGPIAPGVRHEDRVLPFRALLLGGQILRVNEPLVDYRVSGGISRFERADQLTELTRQTAARIERTLPDARQRLEDAERAGAGDDVIRQCKHYLAEQAAVLAMAREKPLLKNWAKAIASGAGPARMTAHLLRYWRAHASQWISS